jgi:hypothetical protein
MTYLKDFCKRHEIAYTDDASLLTHADVKAIFNKELKKFNPCLPTTNKSKPTNWSAKNGRWITDPHPHPQGEAQHHPTALQRLD